jgi:hypothetical protein
MEVDMYDETVDLKEKLYIIKHSELADAMILDENYRQLIRETPNETEQKKLIALRTFAQCRIKELTDKC